MYQYFSRVAYAVPMCNRGAKTIVLERPEEPQAYHSQGSQAVIWHLDPPEKS